MRQFIRDVDENGDPVIKELGASSLTLKQIVADGGLIQKGTVTLPALTAGNENDIAITFPTPFSAVPSISVERVATSSYWSSLEWTLLSRSATGFVLHVINNGAGTIPAGLLVEWTAIAGAVIDLPPAINYSTTEQKTGRKWIDGKDIYVRTLNCANGTTMAVNAWNNLGVAAPSGMKDCIDAVFGYKTSDSNISSSIQLVHYPFVVGVLANGNLAFWMIANLTNIVANSGILTIEYTKN